MNLFHQIATVVFAYAQMPAEALVTLHKGLHLGAFMAVLAVVGTIIVGMLLAARLMIRTLCRRTNIHRHRT